jgi:hypothetical protein
MQHGCRSEAQDRMLLDSGAQARLFVRQGRMFAWTMRRSYGSEAQARMLLNSGRKLACFSARVASLHAAWLRIRGASSHAFKLGAQARMLFSQGRKLAWIVQHGYR